MLSKKVLKAGLTDNEINYELKILCRLQPKTIVEIGSAEGGHVNIISSILKEKKHRIISIDPWNNQQKYEDYCSNISVLEELYQNIDYISIQGKSQSPRVIAELKRRLSSFRSSIDYLFIDGSHLEESVISDWKNYQRFVNKNGIICLHDVLVYNGVASAWQKIVQQLNSEYSNKIIDAGGRFLLTGEINVHLGLGYIYRKNLDKKIKTLIESFNNQ